MTGLKRTLRSRRGFTLVELIVVLVILGITAGIGVPALTGYVDNAKEKQAVSETQACVETATRIGAQKYALVQSAVMTGDTGSDNANALTKWAGTLDTKAPIVSGGTVALTEGSGQYLLNVPSPPSGGIATIDDLAGIARVSGHVSTMTCNANGQVLYLVYTSADGIQVVYTATGTTASVDGSDDTIVVPKPDDGKTEPDKPDVPDVPDVPAVKKLDVTFKIVDAGTGEDVIGATMKVMQGGTTGFEKQWETTTDSPTYTLQLTAGSYTYQEFISPDEYYQANDPISFLVSTDSDGNLYVKDNSNVTVSGTSVTVTMRVKKKAVSETTMKVTFVKKDSYTDSLLEGAKLQIVDESGKVLHSWTSQKDTSEKVLLPAGSYYYEEVEAPAHYEKAERIHFTLTKEKKNDLKLSCDDPNAKADDTSNNRIVMKDAAKTTTVVFWASDEAHNNLSGVPLKLTGKLLSTRSDSDREWISDSNVGHTLKIPLVPGTYQFMVNNADTYTQDFAYYVPMWVTFEVDDNGNLKLGAEHSVASNSALNGEAYLENKGTSIGLHLICKTKSRQLNSVTFYKRDTAGNDLDGAKFTITDAFTNSKITELDSSPNTSGNRMAQKLKNNVLIYYNKVYCLHETKAPDGYKLAADVYFKIALENGETVLYSSDSRDGSFTLASEGGKYITVVDEKKDTDGELILTGSDVKVTINGAKPWPAKDTVIHPGEIYYEDKDGERTYYIISCYGDSKAADTPENTKWAAKLAKDKITNVWTDSTMKVANDGSNNFVNVKNGDLYIHNDVLYLYKNSSGNEWTTTAPPWSSTDGSWVIIGSPYEVKIERKHATVNINLVDSISRTNVSGLWLRLETFEGKLLQAWQSTDEPRVFDLSPGTYKVVSKDKNYPENTNYQDLAPYTFNVYDNQDKQTVDIDVPYAMVMYQITVTAYDKQWGVPLADAEIQVKGTCISGYEYTATATTNKNGQATLNVPASQSNTEYTFTALPKDGLTCDSTQTQFINYHNYKYASKTFVYN